MLKNRLVASEELHVGRTGSVSIRSLVVTMNSLDSGVQGPPLEALNSETEVLEVPPLQIDQEMQDFITKIEAINPQTVKDDKIVEAVLQESLKLLHQRVQNNPDSASQLALIQSMQQLLESWTSMHFQLTTTPRTNRPFQI